MTHCIDLSGVAKSEAEAALLSFSQTIPERAQKALNRVGSSMGFQSRNVENVFASDKEAKGIQINQETVDALTPSLWFYRHLLKLSQCWIKLAWTCGDG